MAGVDVWVKDMRSETLNAHHWSVDESFTYHLQVSKKQNRNHKNKVVNLISIINFLLITSVIRFDFLRVPKRLATNLRMSPAARIG